jgi:hypothetical protein
MACRSFLTLAWFLVSGFESALLLAAATNPAVRGAAPYNDETCPSIQGGHTFPLQTPILDLATRGPPRTRDDLALLFVFFNPLAQHSLLRNYLLVADIFELQGIPFFTLNVRSSNVSFIAQAPNVFTLLVRSCLFQKEKLIMNLLERVPKQYTKVLALDADVLLYTSGRASTHWYDVISEALDTADALQPFACACKLDDTLSHIYRCKESIVAAPLEKGDSIPIKQPFYKQLHRYHPGYAWAFRRDWLARVGLFDLAVVGGGDTLLSAALRQVPMQQLSHQLKPAYASAYADYFARVGATRPRVGYAEGLRALHLYHGNDANRHYSARHVLLDNVNLSTVLVVNVDGVFETTPSSAGRAFNESVCRYMHERRDDQ